MDVHWDLNYERTNPSTHRHDQIAKEHGNQMTQCGMGVTIYNFPSDTAAAKAYGLMKAYFDDRFHHSHNIRQVRVSRRSRVVFTHDNAALKWEVHAEGVSGVTEALQSFLAIVLSCEQLNPNLVPKSLVMNDHGYFKIIPAV